MARAGLSFANPTLQDTGLGLPSRPSTPFAPGNANIGPSALIPAASPLDTPNNVNLAPSALLRPSNATQAAQAAEVEPIDPSVVGQSLTEFGSQFLEPTQPAGPRPPRVYFSESTGRLHVGGFTFNENNASDALRSRDMFGQLTEDVAPPADAPDWRALDPEEYAAYLDEIENPGLSRIAGEAFQTGMRSMGETYNAALIWAGVDAANAQRRIEEIQRGHYRDAPFQRNDIANIDDGGDLLEFAVASIAQSGPWLIESAITAAAGAAVGSVVAGPGGGTLSGAAASLAARGAAQRAVRTAVGHYAATSALPRGARMAAARASAVRAGEEAMFDQGVAAINAARNTIIQGGAAAGLATGNLVTGTGDVYNEMLSEGVSTDDADARAQALVYGMAYAGLDTATDLLAGAGLLGKLRLQRNAGVRIPTAVAGGAVAEGLTEGAQEALVTHGAASQTGREWGGPEDQARMVNAAAAGAIPGALMGGVAGVRAPQQPPFPDFGTPAPAAPPAPPPAPPTPPTSPAAPPGDLPVFGPGGAPVHAYDTSQVAAAAAVDPNTFGTPYGAGIQTPDQAWQGTTPNISTETMPQQELPLDTPAQPNRGATPELEALYAAIRNKEPLTPEQQEHLVRLQNTPRAQLSPEQLFVLQTAYPQSTDKAWTNQPMRRAGPLQPRQQEPQQGELPLEDSDPQRNAPVIGADGKPVPRRNTLTDTSFVYPDGSPAGDLRSTNAEVLNKPQAAINEFLRLSHPDMKNKLTFAEKQFIAAVQSAPDNIAAAWKTLSISRNLGVQGTQLPRAKRRQQQRDLREANRRAEEERKAAEPQPEPGPPAKETATGVSEAAKAKLEELKGEEVGKARTRLGGLDRAQVNKEKAGKPRDYTAEEIDQMWEALGGRNKPNPVKEKIEGSANPAKEKLKRRAARKKPRPDNKLSANPFLDPDAWKLVVGSGQSVPEFVASLMPRIGWKTKPKDFATGGTSLSDAPGSFIMDHKGQTYQLPEAGHYRWYDLVREEIGADETEIDYRTDMDQIGGFLNDSLSIEMTTSYRSFGIVAPANMTGQQKLRLKAILANVAGTDNVSLEVLGARDSVQSAQHIRGLENVQAFLAGKNPTGGFRVVSDDEADDAASVAQDRSDFDKIERAVRDSHSKYKTKIALTVVQNADALTGKSNNPGEKLFPDNSNPALFAQMKAAFAGTSEQFDANLGRAQGYSFTDSKGTPHVIIFLDNIRSEQEGKFVLAYEALGRVGLGAFVRSDGKLGFDKLNMQDTSKGEVKSAFNRTKIDNVPLQSVLLWAYSTDPAIKRHVEIQREIGTDVTGDLTYQIETALADRAAELETSILKRLGAYIKDALNAVGVQFDDDLTRFLINQMRRHVKHGSSANKNGVMFNRDFVVRMAGVPPASANDLNKIVGFKPGSGKFRVGAIGGLEELGRTASTTQNIRADLSNRATLLYSAAQAAIKGGNFGKAILDTFRTQDDAAFKNRGVQLALNDVFAATNEAKRADVQRYKDMMVVSQTLKPTPEQRREANDMLNYASLYNHDRFTYDDAKDYQLLNIAEDGTYTVNKEQFEKLSALTILTPEQFNAGLTWRTADGEVEAGTYKPKETLTADSIAYKIYVEHMKVRYELELDKLRSYFEEQGGLDDSNVRGFLNKYARGKYDETNVTWFKRVQKEFYTLYYKDAETKEGVVIVNKKSAAQAENFLEEVLKALHSDEKRKDWTDKTRTDATRKVENKDGSVTMEQEYAVMFRDDAAYDDIISGMDNVARLGISQDQQINMLKTYQNSVTLSQKVRNAETSAIMSIGRGHVPLVRRGAFQMRVAAFDENGNPVKLDAKFRSALPYALGDTLAEMKEYGTQIQKALDDSANKWKMENEDGEPVTVTLRATWSAADTTAGLAEPVSVESFLNIATTIGIGFNDAEMRKIVRALSAVEATIRKRVQRAGTPGFDPDASRALAEMFDRTASSNAKRRHGYKLPAMLENDPLWTGDAAYLAALQKRFDAAVASGNEYAAIATERDLVRYAWQYAHSAAPGAGAETFTINTRRGEQTYKLKGLGKQYREQIKELARFYRSKEDIDNPEDLLSGGVGSNLKVLTVASTLGGNVLNIASGLMNLTSLYTNTIPYLAYQNKTTGFGMGSGMPRASAEVAAASANMIDPSLSEPSKWDEIVKQGTWEKHGLRSADEALFMQELARHGLTDAAMSNQFLGTARNKTRSVLAQKALDVWMGVFSGTEQFNRRVTGLATYRLHRARALEAGLYTKDQYGDVNSQAFKDTFAEARRAIDTTQGQHDMWNRPAMFRGNILGHVFMFKQFVVNSIQLIGRLPPQGQLAMLALYVMMAGIKGLPFAEDIMDLVDVLLQKLGIRQASVELWLTRALDEIAPGTSPYVMYGLINRVLEGTVSSRVGLGDVVPFTGVLREGADVAREIENAIGPAFGTALGWGEWGALSLDGAAMVLGLKDPTMGVGDWARHAPVSAIRSITETAIFASDGTITNQRGQIVSEDVTAQTIAMRALGFYPTEATLANNIVRLGRIENMYVRSIKADYVNAWARARRRGQTDVMRRIESDVAEWNRRAREAGDDQYAIRNFRRDALRSAREGDRTATERFSRTGRVPEKAVDDLITAYGMD